MAEWDKIVVMKKTDDKLITRLFKIATIKEKEAERYSLTRGNPKDHGAYRGSLKLINAHLTYEISWLHIKSLAKVGD